MTDMTPIQLQLAEKLPRYSLTLALQVDAGDGFQTINRLEGARPDERKFHIKLSVEKRYWQQSRYFGDAPFRIVEIDADGNPILPALR